MISEIAISGLQLVLTTVVYPSTPIGCFNVTSIAIRGRPDRRRLRIHRQNCSGIEGAITKNALSLELQRAEFFGYFRRYRDSAGAAGDAAAGAAGAPVAVPGFAFAKWASIFWMYASGKEHPCLITSPWRGNRRAS